MGIRNFRNYGILERLVALGYLELIEDVTISVATTSVTFSGFTATKEDSLVLVSDLTNPTTTALIQLFANNNQIQTNYWAQLLTADGGATPTGARTNRGDIGYASTGNKSLIVSDIKLTNDGYFTSQNSQNYDYDTTSILLRDNFVSSTFTSSSLTQLDIVSNVANAIGIGSRFQLYRKVA